MFYALLFFFLIGVLLTIAGWKISFTKEGPEWMYRNKYWKKDDQIYREKEGKRFDRIRGVRILLFGLVWSIGSLVLLWLELFK